MSTYQKEYYQKNKDKIRAKQARVYERYYRSESKTEIDHIATLHQISELIKRYPAISMSSIAQRLGVDSTTVAKIFDDHGEYLDRVRTEAKDGTYPFIKPCINCKYWRLLDRSHRYFDGSASKFLLEGTTNYPACHYFFDTGILRGPRPKDGVCDKYEPREKKKRGRPKKEV